MESISFVGGVFLSIINMLPPTILAILNVSIICLVIFVVVHIINRIRS